MSGFPWLPIFSRIFEFATLTNRAQVMGLGYSKIDLTIRAPIDGEFVQSFSLSDDPQDILKFYNLYGFVVFREILGAAEIDNSIDELWRCFPGAKRDDSETWEAVNHPFSFVGEQPLTGNQMWMNRQNPNVYRAFKLLYEVVSGRPLGKEPLVACVDRGSIMLPTTGPNGRNEWMVQRIPHFDTNPFVWHGFNPEEVVQEGLPYVYPHLMLSEGNNNAHRQTFPKLRAVLQLSESTNTTGGFECCAGFHRSLRAWCQAQQHRVSPGRPLSAFGWGVPLGDPIEKNMQKITMRAGSMVVFSAELPHTMFPNESSQFRYAQYLRMAPLSTLQLTPKTAEMRKTVIKGMIPGDFEATDIGREVFLLDLAPDEVTAFAT